MNRSDEVRKFKMMPDPKAQLPAGLGLAGLAVFLVLLFTFLAVTYLNPPFMVSYEFAARARPLAVSGGIFVSLTFGFIFAAVRMRERGRPAHRKDPRRLTWLPVFLLGTSLFLGWMSYAMLLAVPAILLNRSAPKQAIEFDVVASSAWPSKDLHWNCPAHLLFDTPHISPSAQFVCLDWEQWGFFEMASFPMTVQLTGWKSYYGYELVYKQPLFCRSEDP